MVDRVTVYTTSTCAYCKMVKTYLEKKGLGFRTINLDQNPEKRQELYEKTNAMTVPITDVDGEFVVGWNPSLLNNAIAKAGL